MWTKVSDWYLNCGQIGIRTIAKITSLALNDIITQLELESSKPTQIITINYLVSVDCK